MKAEMDAAVIGDAESAVLMERLKNAEDADGGVSALLGSFLTFLDPSGTVLITGGTGELASELARHLVRIERAGMIIILTALFILPWISGKIGFDLNVFRWLIGEPTAYLMDLVFSLTGVR